MKWTDAEKYCEDQGGHLASISSIAIHNFLLQSMASRPGMKWHVLAKAIWVGGYDFDDETNWKWTDCSPFQHLFWGEGEPNNHKNNQHCTWIREDGKWDDLTCKDKKQYVCQKPLIEITVGEL